MVEVFHELKNGIVLTELGGYGDGPYCAKHGAGATLVMLGTYIVDQGNFVPYPPKFVFKPEKLNYSSYLHRHVTMARASNAKVGVSVISVQLAHTIDFLLAAQEAGAEYVSLCAHSSMEMFVKAGLGNALCRRESLTNLKKWATAILDVAKIPVIFKIGLGEINDTIAAMKVMTESGVPIIHVNVGSTDLGSEGIEMLKLLAGRCRFLIASGGIKDIEGVQRVLEAGADAVAIGTAAMKDPDLCYRVKNLLRNE